MPGRNVCEIRISGMCEIRSVPRDVERPGDVLVVVPAEVAVGLTVGEHVPVGNEHRVLHSAERAAVADPRSQALILGLEVAAFGAGRGERGFFQGDSEELAALAPAPRAARMPILALPGRPREWCWVA